MGLARGLLAVRDHRFVGYYIRRSVEDAPIFVESYRRQKEARKKAASLKDALAAYPGKTFFSILLRVGENTVYYVIVVFSITYLTVHAKLPSQTVMFIMFIANIFQFFSMLFGGYLSDRIGRKACIALGYAGLLVWAFLYFPGLDSGSNVHILGVICMGLFFQALCYGPQAAYFGDLPDLDALCRRIVLLPDRDHRGRFDRAAGRDPVAARLRRHRTHRDLSGRHRGAVPLALAVLSETRNVSLHEVDRAHQDRHGA